MAETTRSRLQLTLAVHQGVTVLPRCLQILSRRGYIVQEMHTKAGSKGLTRIILTVNGETRWHAALPGLLIRLVEVEDVEVKDA